MKPSLMFASDQGVHGECTIAREGFLFDFSCGTAKLPTKPPREERAMPAVLVRVTIAWRVGRIPDLCARKL